MRIIIQFVLALSLSAFIIEAVGAGQDNTKGSISRNKQEDDSYTHNGGFNFISYNKWLEEKLGSDLQSPDTRSGGAASVAIDILKDGTIGTVKILSSSSSFYLDQKMLRAVTALKPPPFPEAWKIDHYLTRLSIVFKDGKATASVIITP